MRNTKLIAITLITIIGSLSLTACNSKEKEQVQKALKQVQKNSAAYLKSTANETPLQQVPHGTGVAQH